MFSSYHAIENGIDDDYKALNPIIDSKKLLVIVDRNNKFLGFKVGDGKKKYNDISFFKSGSNDTTTPIKIDIDDELSDTSTNPVQNKVITEALRNINIPIDNEINEESENPVQNKVIATELRKLFQSVSDGKQLIALAITDKGVITSATDSFEQMAKNIMSLKKNDLDIRVYDIFTSIIPLGDLSVANMKDSVNIKTQIPTGVSFTEVFTEIKLNGLSVASMTDTVSTSDIDFVVHYYTIDISKKSKYTYNQDYVLTDTKFGLKTGYEYYGVEETIDSGRMQSIELDFTKFASVEEVTISNG